jgi:hypothetical protein
MFSHKSGSATASENVTKRSRKLEEMMEVIRRMEGAKSRPTLCMDLNMTPSTAATIMKNADKITKTMETTGGKSATTLRYSRGPVIGRMEELP